MSDLKRIVRPELEKIISDAMHKRLLLATRLRDAGLAPQQKCRVSKRVLTEDAVEAYINEVRRGKHDGA